MYLSFDDPSKKIEALKKLDGYKLIGNNLKAKLIETKQKINTKTIRKGNKKSEIEKEFSKNYKKRKKKEFNFPPLDNLILKNITNSLIGVPQFYIQVLKLMNEMNLPAPFKEKTIMNKMYEKFSENPQKFHQINIENENSSDESELIEIDSSDNRSILEKQELYHSLLKEETLKLISKNIDITERNQNIIHCNTEQNAFDQDLVNQNIKENIVSKKKRKRKKKKKKNEKNIPTSENKIENEKLDQQNTTEINLKEKEKCFEENNQINEKDNQEMNKIIINKIEKSEFILDEPLFKIIINKCKLEQILLSFPSYEIGIPSNKIYIKNLPLTITTSFLISLFSVYFESEEEATQKISLKLFTKGRMKGQWYHFIFFYI